MEKTTRIVLIRHGAVENPHRVIYGRLPRFRLSREGIRQAERAAVALRNTQITALYSSPLLRARQTARQILRFHPKLNLRRSSLLNEVLTSYEGGSKARLRESVATVYQLADHQGEQPAEVLARSRKFINKARKEHGDGSVVAVTHGDVIFFLMLWAKRLPVQPESKIHWPDIEGLSYPATGSITTLPFSSDDPREIPQCDYFAPSAV